MANKYRVRLGRSKVGPDLITNGGFSSGAGWTVTAPSSISGGRAIVYDMYQSSVVTPGKHYEVAYDLLIANNNIGLSVAIGDIGGRYGETRPGRYVYRNICLKGNAIRLSGYNTEVDNVTCYELDWNAPLVNEPIGMSDLKFSYKRETTYRMGIVTFTSEIEFVGDGYRFIEHARDTEGHCAEIPVLIEMQNPAGGFEIIFEGLILVSKCEFDLTNRKVKASIVDSNATVLVDKAKDVAIPLDTRFSIVSPPLPKPTHGNLPDVNYYLYVGNSVVFHKTTDGSYPSLSLVAGWDYDMYNVGRALERMIYVMTDSKVGFKSDFFTSGTYSLLSFMKGNRFVAGQVNDLVPNDLSFDMLFKELDKIFCLGIAYRNIAGVPTIQIEPRQNFPASGSPVVLDRIRGNKGITQKYDESFWYRGIQIGYQDKDGTKTPNIMQFDSQDICSQSSLNLVSEWVTDSDIIYGSIVDGIGGNNHEYFGKTFNEKVYLVEVYDPGPTFGGNYATRQHLSGGKYMYNEHLDPDDNFNRWKGSLPSGRYANTSTGETIETTLPLERILEFEYPISAAIFDLIKDPARDVQLSGAGLGTPISGVVLEMTVNPKGGLATFKVLAE